MKPLLLALIPLVLFGGVKTNSLPPSPAPPLEPPAPWEKDLFRQDTQVFSSHLEFLFWKTYISNASYALKMNQAANNITYPIGQYKNASYNIEPGFRLALSFFRAARTWEVWGMYTRLTARGTTTATPPTKPNQYLDSVWPTFLSTLTDATTSLHLNYNVADFMVDRAFFPNYHLRLRLLAGITGTWMDQDWNTFYADVNSNQSSLQNQWKFGGVGLRAGLMSDWFWTNDFYITLRGTFAAVMGNYSNHAFQTTTGFPSLPFNNSVPIRNTKYRDTRPSMNYQFLIGPSYQKNLCAKVPDRIEVFVGYELNLWTNVQEIYHSTGANAPNAYKEPWIISGVLSLQGLTARVTLDW